MAGGGRARETVEMIVPASKAGLIIGSHGDSLRRIEKQAQVKMQFDQQWKGHNENERKITIVGFPEDVEEARRLIMEKIMEDSRGGRGADDARYQTVQCSAPAAKIGLIIGRGGETIKDIQDRSGARIFVNPDGVVDSATGERPISISGDAEAISRAKAMINDILFGLGGTGQPSQVLQIPDSCIGAVMGKRAEILKSIIAACGGIVKIFVEHVNIPGTSLREVQLSGPPEMCAYAVHLIQERVVAHQQSEGYLPMPTTAASGADYDGPEHRAGAVMYQTPADLASAAADYATQAQEYYAANGAEYDQAALAAYYAQYYQSYYAQQQYQQPQPE